MKEIVWTDNLAVGVGLIDEQHKLLIKHLNDLKLALASTKGPAHVTSTLDFLIEYTNFHFGTEEKHMAANNYPEIDFHKSKHEEFKKNLRHMEADLQEEGATQDLADEMDALLVNWLIQHIQSVDVAFGKYLMSKGIELPAEG